MAGSASSVEAPPASSSEDSEADISVGGASDCSASGPLKGSTSDSSPVEESWSGAADGCSASSVSSGASAASARPWTAVNFLSGSALGALFFGDQSLPVGDRDLVIVGMDFTEGKKTMPVAAVVDKGCL